MLFELTLLVPEHGAPALSDLLIDELGALSVSVEDADADSDREHALFGEPGMAAPPPGWQRSLVKALFDDEAGATAAVTRLVAAAGTAFELRSIAPLADQDWVRLTQAQFAPVAITPSFWIVPSWHEPPAAADLAIRLDPGQAFGTGTHPTTRMCLRWIAARAPVLKPGWRRVLDYGCGSGILAIGAALHGAGSVEAVDIDPAAVEASRANAATNRVDVRCGLPEVAAGRYDLVLANILSAPLKLLAPVLCGHLAGGAHLVLAGILERQVDELREAYAPWLALGVADADDGWALLAGRAADDRMASSPP